MSDDAISVPSRPRRAGLLKRRIFMADDFDRLPDDIVDLIEGWNDWERASLCPVRDGEV